MENLIYIGVGLSVILILAGLVLAYRFLTSPGSAEEAKKLIEKGYYKDAIALLEKLLEKEDRDPDVNFLLGIAHQKLGDFSNAVMYFRRILKFGRYNREVNEIVVRTHLASSLENNGNFQEAKNEYIILTSIEPTNIEHYYNAGRLLYRSKLLQNTVSLLKKGLQVNGRHFPSLSLLGKSLFQLKEYTEAKIHLEKAREINPNDMENLYYLAQTLRYTGDSQKAIQILDIVEKDQKFKSRALLLKGIVLIDMESYSQGISELEKAAKLLPKGSQEELLAHYFIGYASEKIKNIDKAIQHWEYIHSLQPDFKDVKSRLKQYADFKTSDIVKDILTASRLQLEIHFRKLLEKLQLKPTHINLDNDSMITAICATGNTQYKMNQTLVRLYREMTPVTETQIREFHELMKREGAVKGIYFSIYSFHPKAFEYCANRPINLYDGNMITKIMENQLQT